MFKSKHNYIIMFRFKLKILFYIHIMLLFLTGLFFIGFYYLYYTNNSNTDGLIELKYDDLYHYQRGIKAYVVFITEFESTFDNMKSLFKQRIIKMIKENEEFLFEKTKYPNKIKKTTKTLG